MNYKVLISEMQKGYVEVNAETVEKAKEKALEEYDKGNVFWNKSEITEIKLENSTMELNNSKPYEFKLNNDESTTYIILEGNKNCALIKRFISESASDPSPYIIAYGLEKKEDNLIEWDRGSYYKDLSGAFEEYSDYTKSLETDKSLIGEIDFISPSGKVAYTTNYSDISVFKKDITECLNDGIPIEVRDYSNQNIYSNAVADMCGYDESEEIEKEQWEQEQIAKSIEEQEKMLAQEDLTSDEQNEFEEDDEMEL